MINHHNELDRAIAELGPHDHLCMVFESRSDQYAAAVPFIQSGLARGERCLVITAEDAFTETKAALTSAGIDLDYALNSGKLALLDNEKVYDQGSEFDPQRMISRLTEFVENALRDGFSALRVTGEMTRVLGDKIGLDRFIKYESAFNDFLKRHPVSALCLYDRAHFEPEMMLDIIRAHPRIIYGREIFKNHFYISPSFFSKKKQADREIKILISMLQSQKKREQEIEQKATELAQKEILLRSINDEKRGLQDRFHSITQHAFNMEYLRAPDGSLLYISPSCERITGYSPDRFLANPALITEIVHPDDRPILDAHQCSSNRSKRREEENEAEFRIIHQDGSTRWIHHTCQSIKDGRGRVIGQRGSNTDITALKEAGLALKESEERFRRLAENAPDLIYHYQIIPERKFTYVSPAATAITGYTPEEHYADADLGFKIVHPDDRHILAKAVDGKRASNPTTLRWVRKDGKVIWTEQHNVNAYDHEGRLIAIEGIARDITTRKEAEATLAGNLDLLRIAGDYAQFGGWSVDLETNVCTWSDAVADIHEMPRGFAPKVEQGIDFYAPEHHARITQVFTDCAVKGIPYNEELQIITSSGRRVWVRTIGEAVRDEHGKIVKVQGSFENIDDRKKAEAEILAHNERLRVIAEILQFNPPTIQAFLDFALENALKLTSSRIGFINIFDEEKQVFKLNAWSQGVLEVCGIPDPQNIYPLEKAGIWGEAVRQRQPIIINDFHAPNALKKGYPEGHAPLNKFLTIPVMHQDRIVAVIGVANKTEDYTDADVLQLSLMMDSVWKVVDQRQAAQALRESEEKYKSLFNQSADGVYLHRLDGCFIEVNRMACQQTGFSKEELLKLSAFDLRPTNSPKNLPVDVVLDRWKKWVPDETHIFEVDHQHKDGSLYPLEISSTAVMLGGEKFILALVKDISSRKQAENALRESEKRFRYVFESANVGKSITAISG